MSILITGGAGYIGSHTCIELLEKGHDIVVLDNYYNSKPECLKRVKEITKKDFPFYECDILDEEGLSRIFREQKIDSVIHFAGYKAVGESVGKPLEYYHNNIEGTLVLCKVMKAFGVKNMVFSSSATVYGEDNVCPYLEDMKIGGCTNPYGQTKFMIELILKDLYTSDPEWNITILRYFNPIGAHKSGLIGEDPSGIPNNLMPFITQVAVGKLQQLPVYGDDYDTPDGTCLRDYVHVVDLAIGHGKAIEHLNKKCGLSVFNLGTGIGTSVLEMVHAFEKACGKPVPHQIVSRRPGDIARCYAAVDKAKNELGFVAAYDIQQMCEDSWRWQSQNPQGM